MIDIVMQSASQKAAISRDRYKPKPLSQLSDGLESVSSSNNSVTTTPSKAQFGPFNNEDDSISSEPPFEPIQENSQELNLPINTHSQAMTACSEAWGSEESTQIAIS